jgi:hypothetical protein
VALLFLEQGRRGSGDLGVVADALLDRSIEAASAGEVSTSLFTGTVGTAFALTIADRVAAPSDGDTTDGMGDDESDIDDVIDEVLGLEPWPGPFDLMRGLVGIGVYELARLPRPRAMRALERVVAQLAAMAQEGSPGVTWLVRPGMVPVERARQFPDGYFDTGLSHGTGGVAAFLGRAAAAGVDGAAGLRDAAVEWLVAHRVSRGGEAGDYPLLFGPGDDRVGGRLAWCYGDAGLAVAFLAAGAIDEGTRLAKVAARRSLDASGVIDAGLCHGSAGLGHVFNRLAQQTGDDEVAEAGRRWFDDALRRRTSSVEAAGFTAVMPDGEGGRVEVASVGLLEGAAGIGLALMAAIGGPEPEWDAAFLLR